MAFPATLPSYIITAGAETANGAAGGTGLSGLLNAFEVDITALGAKLGTGASTSSNNTVLRGNGAGTSVWGAVVLTTDVSGILPVANGGTGQASLTNLPLTAPVITTPPTNVARLPGEIVAYAGFAAPSGWLYCDGAAISRVTFSGLFAILCPAVGTCTITNATPAVVTLNSHNLQTGDQVYLTTTSGLPTGLAINTLYYVIRIDANTFNLATSRANAFVPTKIATSSAGSGVHTLNWCANGLGDGTTTFNVPDLRGRVVAGNDSMNGSVASRLTLAQSQGVYGNAGATGGEQGHQITTAELAAHSHGWTNSGTEAPSTATSGTAYGVQGGATFGFKGATIASQGSDTAHNNIQPAAVENYIIKT